MGLLIFFILVLSIPLLWVLTVRLLRRTGKAPKNAGPAQVLIPSPPGQQGVPWELQAINNQLPYESNTKAKPQLIFALNRIIEGAGVAATGCFYLPANASVQQVSAAISLLEANLNLGPSYNVSPTSPPPPE